MGSSVKWERLAGEAFDLGTHKVNLYMALQGFPDDCALIEISREELRNAIDSETAAALGHALDELDKRPGVRVVFMTGRGHKAFVSGGDLREYTAKLADEAQVLSALGQMRQVLWRLYIGARFAVAVLNGPARGGGSELAFSCHYRLFQKGASFGFVQATQGIPPGWGGGTLLTERMGQARARLALMSGAVFDAQEALRLGFADEVADSDERLVERMRHLAMLFAHSTTAGMAAVQGLLSTESDRLYERMVEESMACARLWFAPEHAAVLAKYK